MAYILPKFCTNDDYLTAPFKIRWSLSEAPLDDSARIYMFFQNVVRSTKFFKLENYLELEETGGSGFVSVDINRGT